jgi:hypothetical protein
MAIAVQPPDYSEQEQQGLVLVSEAEDLKVTDQATFDQAAEMLKTIKAYLAEVKKVTAPVVAATHAAWKAALAQQQGLAGKAEEAERILKYGAKGNAITPEPTSIAGYQKAEKAKADAAKAEMDRIQREAEAQARAQAKATGAPVQAVVVFTPPPPQVPKAAGVAFTPQWGFEITDAALIPREYLMVDEKKIGAVVRAMKAQTNIPGVKAIEGTGVRG